MGYSFSTLKAGQWLHRAGSQASCYIYVVSVEKHANIFKAWTNDNGGFKKIEFETITRSSWNNYVGPHIGAKMDKRRIKEEILLLSRSAIQSIFTYNEYYLKNSDNWGS